MQGYVFQRLALVLPTLFGVSVLIFVAMRVLPGDPTDLGGSETASAALSAQQREAARKALGIDRPLVVQYADWMGDVLRGDLGRSFAGGTPVSKIIKSRAPISAQIAVMAVILSWLIGLPAGTYAALHRNTWRDYASRFLTTLLMAVPAFWLGMLMLMVLVLVFTWRPPLTLSYLWDNPAANLQITIGPALALGIGLGCVMSRITRSAVLEVLASDYVRTAHAKGLRARIVIGRHVLRNALLPVLTISGLALGGLLGGAVAVETAFAVPGTGQALVTGLAQRDWILIQNLVLLYGAVFVLINLAIDLLYGVIDPRIRRKSACAKSTSEEHA